MGNVDLNILTHLGYKINLNTCNNNSIEDLFRLIYPFYNGRGSLGFPYCLSEVSLTMAAHIFLIAIFLNLF